MEILLTALIGLMVGIHNATWGMYKDSPHEGFSWPKYFRSVLAGLILAFLAQRFFQLDLSKAANLFLLFGSTYTLERVTMEVYKTFLRIEDQSKYFIPMQLSVFGKPVESYGLRLVLGACYVGAVFLIAYTLYSVSKKYNNGDFYLNPFIMLLPCSVFGWVSAFGGAWKDAPLEGFETFKFFRSPAVAYSYAAIAGLFTSNLLIIALCSIGFTIASIETYKTFFFLHKPRGKFQGKPELYPQMRNFRKNFVPVYVAIWIFVIITFLLGLKSDVISIYSKL